MSQAHAMESLLRPPVEFWSALVAVCAASIAWWMPWALLMTPTLGLVTALGLTAFALWRARQGFQAWNYQRRMKRMPTYVLKTHQIPVSHRKLFLGRGFRWTQQHTQRLRDTLRPEVRRFVEPGALYLAVRRFENAAEHRTAWRWVAGMTGRRTWWNPLKPLPPVGGKPQIHAVEPREHDAVMDLSERTGHTIVLGTTRVGKTRLAELLITQDIRRGEVVIVIDPKGDAELMKRVYAEALRCGRGESFYLFHLGFPEFSARYNSVGHFSRITEVATRIASPLPHTGNSAAFREFAWRYTNIIVKAIVALGRRPDYRQIQQHINDIEPLFIEYARHWLATHGGQGWEARFDQFERQFNPRAVQHSLRDRSRDALVLLHYFREHKIHDAVLEGLASVFKYDRTYFDKTVSSLGPLLEKLTSGKVADLLSPDYFNLEDARPIFDWMQVIRENGIVYMGLDALSDPAVASAFGSAAFSDLVSIGGHLYKHGMEAGLPNARYVMPKISLHCDEFSDLMGDEFVPLANKIGGAGFQLTVYTQSAADIRSNASSEARAAQVVDNLNTMIMFRVKSKETALLLTDQLPEVQINSLTMVSGVTDSSAQGTGVDFVSRNEDRLSKERVPLLQPSDLMDLPKGQAFVLMEGGHLWKVRMPLPDPSGDPLIPDTVEVLAQQMRRRYRTSERWWQTGDADDMGTRASPKDAAACNAIGDDDPQRDVPSEESERASVMEYETRS